MEVFRGLARQRAAGRDGGFARSPSSPAVFLDGAVFMHWRPPTRAPTGAGFRRFRIVANSCVLMHDAADRCVDARSCDPAPPARKNERFLCTHAPGARGRLARAARRSAGRFFYAVLCALIMQSRRFLARPGIIAHNRRLTRRRLRAVRARPPSASRPRERRMGKVGGRVYPSGLRRRRTFGVVRSERTMHCDAPARTTPVCRRGSLLIAKQRFLSACLRARSISSERYCCGGKSRLRSVPGRALLSTRTKADDPALFVH
ncbi:Uncharacterised protein [Burkholderia oklahomensis]|nr:Uncharacterised protein [Burkholderia oklahomensis]